MTKTTIIGKSKIVKLGIEIGFSGQRQKWIKYKNDCLLPLHVTYNSEKRYDKINSILTSDYKRIMKTNNQEAQVKHENQWSTSNKQRTQKYRKKETEDLH